MNCDFNNNMLPDGYADEYQTAEAVRICRILSSLGVRRVYVTPKYRCRTTAEAFFRARTRNLINLKSALARYSLPLKFLRGVELEMSPEILKLPDLSDFTYEDSDYILMRIRREDFAAAGAYINAVVNKYHKKPVIAAAEELLSSGECDYAELLSNQNTVFQISTHSMTSKATGTIIKKLVKSDRRIIFGTEASDISFMSPDTEIVARSLSALFDESEAKRIIMKSNAFLQSKYR